MRIKIHLFILLLLTSFTVFSQSKINKLSSTIEDHLHYLMPPQLIRNKSINDTAFVFNIHRINNDPLSFYSHTLNGFANRSLISEGLTRPVALSWNQEMTVLYGVNIPDLDLVSINPETGASTHLADFSGVKSGETIFGLSIDENNVCYVVSSNELNSSTLYQCNLSTGALTIIGSQSVAALLVDITSSCDDKLYGFDAITNSIYTINKDNGSVTLIGDIGINSTNEFTSIMYDRESGVLYQYPVIRNDFDFPFSAFTMIDSNTGEATLLSDFVSGIFNGAIKTSCANNGIFKINPGINGTWFNPNTAGQGFLIDVLPDSDTFFIAWFTNDTSLPDANLTSVIGDPGQRWLTAQGSLSGSSNSVTLDIFSVSGGIFNQPLAVTNEAVGTMTVSFADCTQGIVDYSFNDSGLSGSIPIQRIVNDNVELCQQLSNIAR